MHFSDAQGLTIVIVILVMCFLLEHAVWGVTPCPDGHAECRAAHKVGSARVREEEARKWHQTNHDPDYPIANCNYCSRRDREPRRPPS